MLSCSLTSYFLHINPEPPSAPRNLQVLQVTTTTVQLSWDPPVSNGGRDDLEYQLSYQIATSSEPATIYGRVNMTEGQISGLRPFTQYVVFVSSENGVSAQDSDTSGRTVSVNITTLEGGEFCVKESFADLKCLKVVSMEKNYKSYYFLCHCKWDRTCSYCFHSLRKVHC